MLCHRPASAFAFSYWTESPEFEGFMDLPPEIRVMVYGFAMTTTVLPQLAAGKIVEEPAITQVCQIMCDEALSVFHKHNGIARLEWTQREFSKKIARQAPDQGFDFQHSVESSLNMDDLQRFRGVKQLRIQFNVRLLRAPNSFVFLVHLDLRDQGQFWCPGGVWRWYRIYHTPLQEGKGKRKDELHKIGVAKTQVVLDQLMKIPAVRDDPKMLSAGQIARLCGAVVEGLY